MDLLPFPTEFLIFGATLIGVAVFHHKTLQIAIGGLLITLAYKLGLTDFALGQHLAHEWRTLANLFGLLLGFAILARYFEESRIPDKLPDFLPDDWKGGLVLLAIVFVMSSFLDNIASAIIGGSIAKVIYKEKLSIAYLAALVAVSNAGGAGSVLGDTTTTMMWIHNVPANEVLHAYIGSIVAFLFVAVIASKIQQKYQPIQKDSLKNVKIEWVNVAVVGLILVGAIITNVTMDFPALGVWGAIVIGTMFRRADWSEIPGATKGAAFLVSLVLIASMMPVDQLPLATWHTTLSLGFVSAIFDNIPLTALALKQGGYDWGVLAYAVGYGGSITWFGSSAGVALLNKFPYGKSLFKWVAAGWFVSVGYVAGFFALLAVYGWNPIPIESKDPEIKPNQQQIEMISKRSAKTVPPQKEGSSEVKTLIPQRQPTH